MATKTWREGASGIPDFPDDFKVLKKAVLQITDIKTNRNKYYAIELHSGKNTYRVFTHYGRTDDLENNPNAGVRESRFFLTQDEAAKNYEKIYKQKTSRSKGYKEINLASSKIGSHKARGESSGHVDGKTLKRIQSEKKSKVVIKASQLSDEIQDFTRYIYDEATEALTSTVAVKITAEGIETPLGVLTLGQIEKGQVILDDLYQLFQKKRKTKVIQSKMTDLSGEFYTQIPHRIGRTRSAAEEAIINTLEAFTQKQDTLQLMRDMLQVNGESGNVLFDDEVDAKYKALNCSIGWLDPKSKKFKDLKHYVEKSQVKTNKIKVKRIYSLQRENEQQQYRNIGNEKQLFHGSMPRNWLGILSRGILLPKVVVSMGGKRTDAGWLGHGIYFANAACTTLYYATPGKRRTRIMAIAEVALGKVKAYTKITYGLSEPPKGYDSCHGLRHTQQLKSEFEDDELVVYNATQQKLAYLVEYTGS